MAIVGWAQVFVGVAFAGLLVLAACSFRVFLAVRGLGRELERTRRRLEPKQSALSDELRRLRDAQESGTVQDGVRSS
ncbi:MAG TPA: hypothetical protein VHJ17_21970 [Thermomonospora sp.]|nr:hypothetical protein [Thermomonospora sp.]